MFHKSLFVVAHQLGDRRFYPTYQKLLHNQWKSYNELELEQEKQLQKMISFAYTYVPYYHKLFNVLKLSPQDIKSIEDLEKLPLLTKDIIKENWNDFLPTNLNKINYYNWSTGGSTGSPFKFRLEKFDRFLSGAMLYRGWSYGGFELGDKMVFLAGSSAAPTLGINPGL
jgi:phenylacetate-CoA ligase